MKTLSLLLLMSTFTALLVSCGTQTKYITKTEKVYINAEGTETELKIVKPRRLVTIAEPDTSPSDDSPGESSAEPEVNPSNDSPDTPITKADTSPIAENLEPPMVNGKYPVNPKILNADVQCEDLNNCPSFVGSLITAKRLRGNGYSYSFCSFTLISEDEIIANDHCFELSDIETNSCKGVYAIFPKTKAFKKEIIECKTIKSVSEKYYESTTGRPDWIILKLAKKVNRDIAAPNILGVGNRQKVNIYPSYYSKDENEKVIIEPAISVKIKKVSCEASMSNVFQQSYITPYSHEITMECKQALEEGNSGSGVINVNNEIVSVFKAISGEQSFTYAGASIDVDGRAVMATNLHCITGLNPIPSSDCQEREAIDEDYIFSGFLANQLSAQDHSDLKSTISDYDFIKWSAPSAESIESFSFNDHADHLNQPGYEYAKSYFYNTKYPQLPVCVKNKEKSAFQLTLPYFDQNFIEAYMTPGAVKNIPMVMKSLTYNFKLKSGTNTFVGSLVRSGSIDEVNHFINLKTLYRSGKGACENAGYPDQCELLENRLDDVNDFLHTVGSPSVLNNEYELNRRNIIDNEVVLPLCK